MKKIPVCFICDKAYIMPASVAITSMLVNRNEETFYHIFIIGVDCSEEDFELFSEFNTYRNVIIEYRFVNEEKYSQIKQVAHISRACLVKFEMSEIVTEYDKMLYIDDDVIIQGDLSDFYDIDLGDNLIAGPYELNAVVNSKALFIAGTFVVNSKLMRDENAFERLLDFRIKRGNAPSMDGVTLNKVYGDRIIPADIKWGLPIEKLYYERKYYTLSELNEYYGTNYKSRREMLDKAVILHYIGKEKPWKYNCFKGVKKWDYYYELSPYRKEVLHRKNIVDFLKDKYREGGLKSIYYLVKDKFLEWVGFIHRSKFNRAGWY